ncbi:MAG: decaprenyl-phosphate phosphoribosyltransferase [Candidatus Omnitrophica bacterium]|nr:decaprenyl-phosphate phosphoribosyltransferase [Candidatus Omnitrophota bacterium]MDD5138449.1 decaprenyl-phosphate phosphoribosyltransferase [Candidatus Omnitrophota bacterium]MDD5537993.1 decaprenyl-phosphate phosphoribosyltransferase [Candidatus Omnitrophota bacterium]
MKDLLIALRPQQWVKNIVLFAGLIFSQNFFDPRRSAVVLAAAVVFCLASSALYLLNDILDIEADRKHPQKKNRPLASGRIRPIAAHVLSYTLMLWAFIAAYILNRNFGIILTVYLILEFSYSAYLKNVVILDIFCISAGFLLRVVAGAVVIDVPISNWLLICTIFLSLFLALGKRRGEMVLLEGRAADHRPVLAHYSLPFIDQMMTVVTASTILSYVLYALSPQTTAKFHTRNLQYSIIFVVYGIFRYLYLVFQKKEGGAPEKVLFSDKPLLFDLLLYMAAVIAAVYF